MRSLALSLAVGLAACTPGPRFVPDGYRDQSVAITSSTRFDAARFAGDWVIIESFDPSPREVLADRVSFTPSQIGYSYIESYSKAPPIDPELAATVELSAPAEATIGAFGRLSFVGEFSEADPIWVIWVDKDHRTAVLGTPSGRMGMIINRTPRLRADRLRAAREILAFNGYDLTQIRKVSP
ncbi:apolipoprotein D and lipocalin family protein [Litoreibacter ponti]|uniref:Apolipoprotein D and lipocalin family protein n=1 Tax=Litoreibacter ponti TaxID=1510457 RepID=A0A2T6BL47_9RHOB|nr:lipocalin family protein [Litoreibacter ponti]PTX56772.1 apolipoprotein D and lipocalin family protein [Litoreibacter ponti]